MRGPIWAPLKPISSPSFPEPPLAPPAPAEASQCSSTLGRACAGEASQLLDSSKENAQVSILELVQALNDELSKGEGDFQLWQQFFDYAVGLPENLRGDKQPRASEAAVPAAGQDLEKQSSPRESSRMWALQLEEQQQQREPMSRAKMPSAALVVEACSGAPHGVQMIENAKGESWQKSRCRQTPDLLHSTEVIRWLAQQLRMEREGQEQRHVALIEGLQGILMGSDLASSMQEINQDAGAPSPDRDEHPATHPVGPLTTMRSSSVERATKACASSYRSGPPRSTINHKVSGTSFPSLHSEDHVVQLAEIESKGRELGDAPEEACQAKRTATPVIATLKHSNTDDQIQGMLVHRGLHEEHLGSYSMAVDGSQRFSRSVWRIIRRATRRIVETYCWDYVMGIIIFASCVNVGVEIQLNIQNMDVAVTNILEHVFLCCFIFELTMRTIAGGRRVATDRWLQLDAMLVVLGVISQWILVPLTGGSQDQGFVGKVLIARLFRLVRLVRLVRFLRMFQPLWKLVNGIIGSTGTVLSAAMLFLGAIYMLACIGVELIGPDEELLADDVTGPVVRRHFASLPRLMLTLIQFATTDSVGQIYFPIVTAKPALAFYFLAVILVLPISLMNLVTAMIVDRSIQSSAHDAEMERARMRRRLKTLIPQLRRIFKELDEDGSGEIDLQELDLSKVREAHEIMAAAENRSLHNLFTALDCDGSGKIDQQEFVDGMCYLLLSKVPIENMQILHMLGKQTEYIGELREVLLGTSKHDSLRDFMPSRSKTSEVLSGVM